jgi:hypothetical protein
MKKRCSVVFIVLMTLFLMTSAVWASQAVTADGYFNGIRLAGKVRVVEYNADIKVKVVTAFPDLKVKVVDYFPDQIGEWQFVEYGEDFTIQFVNNFPDIKIKYVSAFPGVGN